VEINAFARWLHGQVLPFLATAGGDGGLLGDIQDVAYSWNQVRATCTNGT
jgi:hypothetical protein